MPQLNQGIVPGGALGTQLEATTRRAFIPSLYVQFSQSNPTIAILTKGSQRARGGLSQITVPIQTQKFVTPQFMGYDGTFDQPTDVSAITNAEFNLSVSGIPIGFLGAEGVIQSSEVVIPQLAAKMNDVYRAMSTQFSQALFQVGAFSATNSLNPNTLPQAFDDGTNYDVYGGLSRAATPTWKSTLLPALGSVLTRPQMLLYLVQVTNIAGGEAPDLVITDYGSWCTLMQQFVTIEQIHNTASSQFGKNDYPNSGFRGFTMGGVTFIADPFCPAGEMYMINTKYFSMFTHEDATFAFSGWYSTIPNMQWGNISLVITAYNTICTKPSSGAHLTGITGGAFTPVTPQ